jgi:hypothetical protein
VTTTVKEPPAEAKHQHEDSALAMLCAEFSAQGRPARVVEHPDRQPGSPLTVDAILDIDGDCWAVDHCLVSRARTLPTAMSVAEKKLLPCLQGLADRYGVGLYVSYLPQTVEPNRKARKANGIGAYYESLLAYAEQTARSGEAYLGDDGMARKCIRSAMGGSVIDRLSCWHPSPTRPEASASATRSPPACASRC